MTSKGPNDNSKSYPKDIDEAVKRLMSELPFADKKRIGSMGQDNLIELHFSLGLYIRNEVGLWQGNEELMESCRLLAGEKELDADDASQVIITALWERLKRRPDLRIVEPSWGLYEDY